MRRGHHRRLLVNEARAIWKVDPPPVERVTMGYVKAINEWVTVMVREGGRALTPIPPSGGSDTAS